MPLSRRSFLKSSVLAAGEMALPAMAAADPASAIATHAGLDATEANGRSVTEAAIAPTTEFTRGVGIYPGFAGEVSSPALRPDPTTYRNLALRRAARHSSSYDYNLTAQLITDGIRDTTLPRWVAVSTSSEGDLSKPNREILLDHFPPVGLSLDGRKVWVQVQTMGGAAPPVVDRLRVFATLPDSLPAKDVRISVEVSQDGRRWNLSGELTAPPLAAAEDYSSNLVQGTNRFYPWLSLRYPSRSRFYRVTCELLHPAALETIRWMIGQVEFYCTGQRVPIGGPSEFTSAWMSAGSGEEWVSVDLGAAGSIDRIALYWIARAAEGKIQVSQDEQTWTDLHPLGAPAASAALATGGARAENSPGVEEIRLPQAVEARYVRVWMSRPATPYGYILSELEVWGRGGLAPAPVESALEGFRGQAGPINITGGAWRVERSSVAKSDGHALSRAGFRDDPWLPASLPGSVLTSFYNAGAIADPNFGENQLYISDSYFCSDFWYRTEFDTPWADDDARPEGVTWLDFAGINWKARIFLNGEALGNIQGGFLHKRFNVTGKLQPGRKNALAVWIEKNQTPGSTKQKTFENPSRNGGALGADNPTFHASIGWDWIPTIRGRNTGIWAPITLYRTGAVTIEEPFVDSTLPLPDTSRASIRIEVKLRNHASRAVQATLRARFGSIQVQQEIHLPAQSVSVASFSPSAYPEMLIQQPRLWWPTGYGEPYLYPVELNLETVDGAVLDRRKFEFGIRQMSYSEDGGRLKIFINGRRFICRGGNWGFSESMLRYRAREYEAAVRYHREMNFTMIRNWVGQVGEEAFYEACDRNGIMVWQDFWLANPWDGPDPDNDSMFMANARDLLLRIRNHASIGLYCGRNEGYPPQPLDAALRQALAELHPGIHYIPSSADDVVSGHGPYHALPPAKYYEIADPRLHSEIGMPNIPPIESVRRMMPQDALWPQGLQWGLHDFCLQGAQGAASFRSIIDVGYGGAESVEEWVSLAQFVSFEGYRAMFESQSRYRAGLLLWMSHPCWPSFVWQTYDYFFEPTAAYFGCKLASEPLHIQWNRDQETVEVVNYSAGDRRRLKASVEILNLDGSRLAMRAMALESMEDSTVTAMALEYPQGLSPVHFLRLKLMDGDEVISANDYMRGLVEGDYRAIRQLAKARVTAQTTTERHGQRWLLTTVLENTSSWPSLMTRLKAVRAQSGDRVLPAIYSENYLMLMPGERRTVTTELQQADTRGEAPAIVLDGFNLA